MAHKIDSPRSMELFEGKRKDSLLKKILLSGGETANSMKLSYIIGLGLGTTGRISNHNIIPAIPLGVDIVGGVLPTPERAACYLAYGAGVGTAWFDKVYSTLEKVL